VAEPGPVLTLRPSAARLGDRAYCRGLRTRPAPLPSGLPGLL